MLTLLLVLLFFVSISATTFGEGLAVGETAIFKDFSLELPLGLFADDFTLPEDNPMTKEKVELGRSLFFDVRLSKDNTLSCAGCHNPEFAFADNLPVSVGVNGQKGERNTPSAINRFGTTEQFWDGRAATLEAQAKGPITNPVEMAMPNEEAVVKKIADIPGYRQWFKKVFGGEVSMDHIAMAIAAFERTIVSGDSKWDRYMAGDESALTPAEKNGLEIFRGKGRCTQCHGGYNLTNEKYHNIGVGWDKSRLDVGRYAATKKTEDIGAFKTPTLREIGRTAPYMHDGRFSTLEDVVDFYNQGGIDNPFLDPEMKRTDLSLEEVLSSFSNKEGIQKVRERQIKGLNLSEEEKSSLVAFLKALNGRGWQEIKSPDSFPE